MLYNRHTQEMVARRWAELDVDTDDIERASELIDSMGFESDGELFAFLTGISLAHDASVSTPDLAEVGARLLPESMVYSLMRSGAVRYLEGVKPTTMPGQYL